jgi:hypothetical protein
MGSKAKRSYMITTLAGRISHISLLSNFIYIRMLARVKSSPHSLARAETKDALINAAILVSESKQRALPRVCIPCTFLASSFFHDEWKRGERERGTGR